MAILIITDLLNVHDTYRMWCGKLSIYMLKYIKKKYYLANLPELIKKGGVTYLWKNLRLNILQTRLPILNI